MKNVFRSVLYDETLTGSLLSHDWRIYDVGGARSLVRLRRIISRMPDELRLPTFISEVRRLLHDLSLNTDNRDLF